MHAGATREDAWIGDERRHPRLTTTFTALHADGAGSFREDVVTNLSRGGLFLSTKNPRPLGDNLELILLLPNSSCEVTVQGEVMFSSTSRAEELSGMGIMFTAIEPSLKIILEEYLFDLEERSLTGRRASPRLENPPIELHLFGAKRSGEISLRNLSRNGLYVETKTSLTLFERVTFALTHPETKESLALQGEVVHLRRLTNEPEPTYGAGIRFIGLRAETEKTVLQLIRRLETEEKTSRSSWL